MRVRDRDRGEPAAAPERVDDLFVQQRLAVPEHVSALAGDDERTLPDRELGLAADAEQPGQLIADLGAVRFAELVERRPLLPFDRHVLARVLANGTATRRLPRLGELRAARRAQEERHRAEVTLDACPSSL